MEEHCRLAMAAAFVILLTVRSSPAMAMAAAATELKLVKMPLNPIPKFLIPWSTLIPALPAATMAAGGSGSGGEQEHGGREAREHVRGPSSAVAEGRRLARGAGSEGGTTTRHTYMPLPPPSRPCAVPYLALWYETERINAGVRRNLGGLPEVYHKKLKIAVPLKHGFRAFVNVSDQGVTGYCIDLFEAAVNRLPYRLIYEFVVFDRSYDELVQSVSSGINDAAVGDITIIADRASHVEFTMPYTESGVSMLVLAENESESKIEWVFLKPLTKELWFATVIIFLFTALVIWIIEHPRNMEYQGSNTRQLSTALYFAFSTLTFSHGQIIKSPLSKIVVVIWCFVVLVLVQSYTASFSSILTVKRFQPSVTDLDQLLNNGDYVGYQEGSFVNSFLTRRGFSERRLRSYTKKQEYAEALRKGSKSGGVSAIVDEIPYLTAIVSDPRYQKEFQMLKRIYKTPGFGFVFPPGFPLVHNLSTAMLDMWVVETMHMKNLIKHRTAWVALWLIYTSMKFRIDSSEDIHGSVERADGEEPRPIQNGSVPANST
uniref:Ionotropic glutamate receptor C-terminal domain-containing protein n=1 Tax=Oryza glumipatula TaxID=40148 RepID=A0A0E0A641_9ORYZ